MFEEIIKEQRKVFGEYYPLSKELKLDLALNSYYLANGTYNEKILGFGHESEYIKKLVANPELFIKTWYVFINNKFENYFSQKIRSAQFLKRSIDLAYELEIEFEEWELAGYEQNSQFKNVFKRFIKNLTSNSLSEKQNPTKNFYPDLLQYGGNDLQRVFSVWSNNLMFDKNGLIVNENYASQRAADTILYRLEGVHPIKTFSEWEMLLPT